MSEIEEMCIQCFLNWYREQCKVKYICQRADIYFPELTGKLNWDFVAYEHDNIKSWIGIEVKELPLLKEPSIKFEFWQRLCSDLTKDLPGEGVQGEFYIFPRDVDLKCGDRSEFRKVFVEVVHQKAPNMKVNEIMDIGPDIADGFPNWPTEKSDEDEYDEWGEDRPCKLRIKRVSDSGCMVNSPMSPTPITVYDVLGAHREAFDAVFKLKNDAIWANEQLKLAKKMGATDTILLLVCDSSVEEGLIKDNVQNLDRQFISEIDCIYLVSMGNKDRVVKMYPS